MKALAILALGITVAVITASRRPDAAAIWSYSMVGPETSVETLEAILATRGRAGWELVTCLVDAGGARGGAVTCILKRPATS